MKKKSIQGDLSDRNQGDFEKRFIYPIVLRKFSRVNQVDTSEVAMEINDDGFDDGDIEASGDDGETSSGGGTVQRYSGTAVSVMIHTSKPVH